VYTHPCACVCYSCVKVSVKFQTVSATAVSGIDFIATADRVTLADGEAMKLVPVTLINSATPRLERYFTVQLLNDTTGGAVIGAPSISTIYVGKTFDAQGIFGMYLIKFLMV